jgi:hypothetical protein
MPRYIIILPEVSEDHSIMEFDSLAEARDYASTESDDIIAHMPDGEALPYTKRNCIENGVEYKRGLKCQKN